MYICIYTYIYICMYACIYIYTHIHIYIYTYIHIYIYINLYAFISLYLSIYLHIYIYIYMYVCMYVYMYIYIYIYIYIYTHIYTYIYTRAQKHVYSPTYMGLRTIRTDIYAIWCQKSSLVHICKYPMGGHRYADRDRERERDDMYRYMSWWHPFAMPQMCVGGTDSWDWWKGVIWRTYWHVCKLIRRGQKMWI